MKNHTIHRQIVNEVCYKLMSSTIIPKLFKFQTNDLHKAKTSGQTSPFIIYLFQMNLQVYFFVVV